ncbi:MAG TPA: hypothetical protein VH877_26820 [Polyangia bacterium]|nr:hypothetical protein [Polyangia bacterium]
MRQRSLRRDPGELHGDRRARGRTLCHASQACRYETDCESRVCTDHQCAAATCTDGANNGSETDVDCGGACPPCANGKFCQVPADCVSGVCTGSRCAVG